MIFSFMSSFVDIHESMLFYLVDSVYLPLITTMPSPAGNNFNLGVYCHYVENVPVPEELRDIAYCLFIEVRQRWTGSHTKVTGFEHLNSYNLDCAFLLVVNELVRRAY